MTPKNRLNINKPHPERWRWKNGAWRYRVPEGMEYLWDGKKEFTLGKTEAEAYRTYAGRMKEYDRGGLVFMEQALDKYLIEVVPTKAHATQRSNGYSINRLRQGFSGVKIRQIKPSLIYQYREYIAKNLSEKHYNLDHEVLSHVFTKCIEWGAIDAHPMVNKGVVKFPTKRRTRYVEDWELEEFLSAAPPFIVAYVNLKMLLGQDKGDMLSIKISAIQKDGLLIEPRKKTSKKRQEARKRLFPFFIECESTGLREALDDIQALPRPIGSIWLFCTRRGQPYIKETGTTSGFDSLWQRAMKKALAETDLAEKFTEHDLRAKVASDAATDEDAQRQLDHGSAQTTRKTYRRKAVVMPVAKRSKKND